jgi:hypothetical protein
MNAARASVFAGRAAGVLALTLSACSPGAEPVTECAAVGHARPVCGLQNPEDLELVPGGRYVLVSQLGKPPMKSPGTLALLDLSNDRLTVVYPSPAAAAERTEGWGDPSCPGPPDVFSPHGLSLTIRPDGKQQLLAVNHVRPSGDAVEFFEVIETEAAPQVAWRGCAIDPELYMNDVAGLPDGGFVVSHMYPRSNEMWQGFKGMLGIKVGHVAEWNAGAGFKKVPGSDGAMPNGVAVSADGEQVFIDVYLANEVVKLARKTGEVLGRADVTHPDNSQWSPDGMLLVASHDASVPTVLACSEIEQGACGARYSIVELDPATMKTRKLYENEGAPMGAGTATVRVGNELIIGTFAGDRIVRVSLGG